MNVYAMKTKETDVDITKEVDVKKKNVVVAKSDQRLPVSLPWTVSAKILNLSKLPASKIFACYVHTEKRLCQGKLVMENSSKKRTC